MDTLSPAPSPNRLFKYMFLTFWTLTALYGIYSIIVRFGNAIDQHYYDVVEMSLVDKYTKETYTNIIPAGTLLNIAVSGKKKKCIVIVAMERNSNQPRLIDCYLLTEDNHYRSPQSSNPLRNNNESTIVMYCYHVGIEGYYYFSQFREKLESNRHILTKDEFEILKDKMNVITKYYSFKNLL